ncbi:MAG: phosphatidate cytidylyltransferase [Clostridia bacterium]|nr:phosphatidate cytidylyltransferase [Clostridia bacterium]
MKTRIITAICMAVLGIPLLIFSEYIIYPIAAGIFAAVAIYEMGSVTGLGKNLAMSVPAYVIAIATPILAYFFASFYFILCACAVALAYMLYLFGYAVVMRGQVKFSEVATQFACFAYIVASFTSLTLIRYTENGVYNFVLAFLAAWICDIFAYFVGRAIGKHKLIPEISPKKTVEGAIGGVFFTAVFFLIYGIIVSYINGAPTPNYLTLAIFGVVLSVVSQFGDLIASLIKREHGVKDYGKIFPGHGGVLDRFDSVVAVAPVLFALCLLFPPFS